MPCCVQVQAISDLSHEVTGVRMYSFFKEEDEKWRKNHGLLGSVRHALTLWQRCGKPGHGARRGYIRSASDRNPRPVGCDPHSKVGCWTLSMAMLSGPNMSSVCMQVPPVVLPQEDALLTCRGSGLSEREEGAPRRRSCQQQLLGRAEH